MTTRPVFLVVDDEPLICKTISMLLKQKLDCEVLEYQDPMEALESFRERKDSITMVITDFFMPGFSGAELCHKIRLLNPDVLLVMISAYGAADQLQNAATQVEIDAFVAKPFHLDAFMNVIRQLLERVKEPADRVNLLVQHFIAHARCLAQGQLAQGVSPVPFVLKLLAKHKFDPQLLADMQALRSAMADEENYLGALEVEESLRAGQDQRVMTIKRWLDVNQELVNGSGK